ncbi:Serine/threonine-protein kinase DCLK [Penicillium digitatum]|uniref:non-specific serine/threonine protein kinase n=1 Tax=Penicillium digitatum TaxID=36651 RepID=A0A7T6XLZ2_PENDI|nr:Serine/threonine-protein kinase DCLK [Penicillium digitatum]
MNWRASALRIRTNFCIFHRSGIPSQRPISAYRRISPLDRQTAWSRRCSSQWTSSPKVFPVFDLRLLDSSLQTEEELAVGYEPNETYTYPAVEEETLNDRCRIMHKIGYGPTATVWYAVDLLEPRMVVLTIYVVDHLLKTYGQVHPPTLYQQSECPLHEVSDRFLLQGSRGPYICVVHEAPSLDPQQMHSGDKMDLESMRSTMQQTLILMDFLHTDCYLTARIMPNATLNVDSGDRRIAGPSNGELLTPMILPGDGVPLRLDFLDDDMSRIEEKHDRPPEQVLKSKSDHKADIWATAVAAWNYTSSQGLIDGRNSDGAFDDRVHVAELVSLLGPPAPEFRDKMRLGSTFWDEEGNWTGQAPIPDRSFESLAAGNVDGEDVEGFLQWMQNALQWDPDHRPTALGLLRHEWMSRRTKVIEGGKHVSDENT